MQLMQAWAGAAAGWARAAAGCRQARIFCKDTQMFQAENTRGNILEFKELNDGNEATVSKQYSGEQAKPPFWPFMK